jgi:hypothetical protein
VSLSQKAKLLPMPSPISYTRILQVKISNRGSLYSLFKPNFF